MKNIFSFWSNKDFGHIEFLVKTNPILMLALIKRK